MTLQAFNALLDAKERFKLKFDNAVNPSPHLSNEYHIVFKYLAQDSPNISWWLIEYIHRYREPECIYPISFRVDSARKLLRVYVQLPTVEKWVELRFPLQSLTLLANPVATKNP